jgi:hypothetical protein
MDKRHDHLRWVQEAKKWTRISVSVLRYTRTYTYIYYSILQIHSRHVQRKNPHAATSIPFSW